MRTSQPRRITPENRKKGYKSRIYTDIRAVLRGMEREQWQEWMRNRLDELQEDSEVWAWLNHNSRYWNPENKGKPRGRRPEKSLLPDTRNTNHDVD